MKNRIIAGDFQGWDIIRGANLFGKPKLFFSNILKREEVSKSTVSRYEIVERKSLGKGKEALIISIELNSGKKALLEVDEKMYKEILAVLY